ncbi:D-alanyl-D-alanine carboxypeptidase family protein [Yinghuangia soli]|uniref:D-alanyl-D-alanine carboxypeptidase family protein n=1 Tax=Yinghuangia soli TaxID=2908204 RepID=A0AA41Q7L2_9ACTN|nr:D-alanyl-D-alanine carboxypeptidase family protein [Yinghuangia soli]MCF2532988.1 D-alanyl-D-alanine carboxypeptidase family protein [Yinghuangia soli]
MNQTPDQGRGPEPDSGLPAGGDAASGGPRHRVGPGPANPASPSYSDAARYLDSAWQASSSAAPAGSPSELPTQVVPIQDVGGAAAGPGTAATAPVRAPGASGAPGSPEGPAEAAREASGGSRDSRDSRDSHDGAAELDLGAYAMGAAAVPQAGGAEGAAGAAGAFAAVPGPAADRNGNGGIPAGPAVEHESGGRRRRRTAVLWGVVGAVTLAGAGLAAVKFLDGGSSGKTAKAADSTPLPVAPPTAGPLPSPSSGPESTASAAPTRTSKAPSTGPSKAGSKSPTSTASTGSKAPVDTDGDGVSDDPGARDPGKLTAAASAAYSAAKQAMAAEGVQMTLTSGKRSYQHQKDLWEQEVAKTGSSAAARNRVLPPDESSHVDGIAIDINQAAQPWMKAKGAQYGWCQIYGNESWHFEFRAKYKTEGCPALKPHP